jgi:uncharacterized protein YyaL (SSP411 family)
MPNRLANESSPYLLQHADNPVDWYPWGAEALNKAKAEDKPIFLSIGYSACHWCHVMAHESFENEQTARLMNDLFINVKVDREERPDLDSIYMEAVVAMTGQGGWPMSVFLTPAGAPFYGGTYFPPTSRYGMPGFDHVLQSVANAYHHQKEGIAQNTANLLARMQHTLPQSNDDSLNPETPALAVEALRQNFDAANGGFGNAPKFPQPMTLDFLLRVYHRRPEPHLLEMIELTLHKMARGGMYDQLGGGFHRYSVDSVWLTPHFEKMLYDNALLARLYLHAFQLTGQPFYRRIVEETLDYVMREMTDPGGGFYSTQDADSEGEEGKFFVWTVAEIEAALGEADGKIFCAAYGVNPGGNFEGQSILHIPHSLDALAEELKVGADNLFDSMERSRAELFAVREQRVKPGRDEKILTAWNGLMLAAFAEAGRILHRPDYIDAAARNAEFVLTTMQENGRLYRTWKADTGQARLMGYLEDYAFYADGLLALYQSTFEPRWFQAAQSLMDETLIHFTDTEYGGFFDTANDHEQLVARPKNLQDNAIPCGNSMAVRSLLLLAAYTGESRYYDPAMQALTALQPAMSQYAGAFTHWLGALELALTPPQEIAIIGERQHPVTIAMLNELQTAYRPNQIVTVTSEQNAVEHPPLAHQRPMRDEQTTAYVCQNFVCRQPVTTAETLAAILTE